MRARWWEARRIGPRGGAERSILLLGALLVPLGLLVILLGWYGAAHTPYTFEQIPYLVSGGLLGLALSIVGGLLYFGYLLARLIVEQREQSAALLDAVRRLEAIQTLRRRDELVDGDDGP